MRTEGAGKGDALRYGVDWKKFGKNYDAVFRKKKRKERTRIDVHASDKCSVTVGTKV